MKREVAQRVPIKQSLKQQKNLLQFGLSREKIAQATGLTQEEVEAIK
ncbi:hypothetical protein TREVI0001_0126 [Treponema vincentii ATCC 35580]|uniref:Uncharacterized protein n=1 Tax=Treponema vincentii ATCC 35580 TaxID=596324 RepID=C8PTI6_9SPIR|nr:hypothetical protein TREVI0001_0126 [Treponema vincentii ATCC 35580]